MATRWRDWFGQGARRIRGVLGDLNGGIRAVSMEIPRSLHPSALARDKLQSLLEQCVERLPCIVRRLWLACLVGNQVPNNFRLKECALVALLLRRHSGGDILAALPQG